MKPEMVGIAIVQPRVKPERVDASTEMKWEKMM